MTLSLSESWVVAWHPSGDFRMQTFREHISMNRAKCIAGEKGAGYVIVGMAGSLEEVRAMWTQIKREKMQREALSKN